MSESYLDPGMLSQLLSYLARLYLKQPLRVPILPVVLYHGITPLTLLRRPHDEFTLTAAQQPLLHPYLPDFTYLLALRSARRTAQREPPLALQGFLEALRSAASGDRTRTRHLLNLAARLYGEHNGARIVHALLTYLFHVTPLAPDTVRGLLSHPRPELENAMLTAAQQLYERGHREGKLEGEAELLRHGFSNAWPGRMKRFCAPGACGC